MVTSPEQIQIFYEISMSIGTSLDLHDTIKNALSTYLKRLNCAAGAVFQLIDEENGYYHFEKVYSIPRNIESVKSYEEAFDIWKLSGDRETYKKMLAMLPYRHSCSCYAQSTHIMALPGFGILFLSVNQEHFDDHIIHSILQLNRKFANACVACLQNESLKQSEEKYRSIFEESQDVIFIRSICGKFIDINPAGLRLFGYSSLKEIQEIDIADDLFKSREQYEKYNAALQGKGAVKQYEHQLKRKDTSLLTVIENSTVIYDAEKKAVACRGIMNDITDKKKLEAQLFQAQKMECLGTLAGGVAHDFNNLLTVINGYSEMALMDVDPDDPLYSNIRSIFEAGEQASKLTSQLLAISRKQVYNLEIIDINHIISSMDNIVKRLIDEDIKIDIHLTKDLPYIKADKTQLEQIFLNLFINARDALRNVNKPGYIKKISVNSGTFLIDRTWAAVHPDAQEGPHVYVTVSDNGTGMPEEIRQKIFEPFFTTKDKNTGTGLGLSVVYGIIKQNNGFIDVSSEPGKGTTFNIYWPITRDIPAADIVPGAHEIISGNETILVVENEEEVCRFACKALTKKGYQVYAAKDGNEALNLIEKGTTHYDLVITDIIMPGLGGVEFIKKARDITSELNVIYVSGYVDNYVIGNDLFEEGVNFIQKPYSVITLTKAVRRILDKSKKKALKLP